MPVTNVGAIDLPAPVAVAPDPAGDPALAALGEFLRAAIVASCTAAWQALGRPSEDAVKRLFFHDPAEVVLVTSHLPALYVWREAGEAEAVADDYFVTRDIVVALWVFPATTQEKERQRSPLANAVRKAALGALRLGRHPAWVVAGDTDPQAATAGSLFWSHVKAWQLGRSRSRVEPMHVQVGEAREVFQTVRFELEVSELLVEGDFDELAAIKATMQTTDTAPLVTNELELTP